MINICSYSSMVRVKRLYRFGCRFESYYEYKFLNLLVLVLVLDFNVGM